jgi:hypothetical protein
MNWSHPGFGTVFLSKMRSFPCAPWKRVRIFERILGVFQDAHFRKSLRTFEPLAHLRRASALHPVHQGTALNPVPFSRKVAQELASASIALRATAQRQNSQSGVGMAHTKGLTASSAVRPCTDSLSSSFSVTFGEASREGDPQISQIPPIGIQKSASSAKSADPFFDTDHTDSIGSDKSPTVP